MENEIKPTQDPQNQSTNPAPTPNPASTPADPVATPQPPAEMPPITPVQPGSPPKSNRLRWLALGLVVLLAAGGAFFALNKVNKPQPTTTASVKKTVAVVKIGAAQPFPTDFYPKTESAILPLEINNQIFEGLTKYQNGNQIVPDLAQSWTNPDNTTWIFKLQPNVTFHNGHSLAAQDVKASLDALQSTDFGQAYGSTIKSVTVVDPGTVKIVTTAPDPLLPSELANLWIYDTTSSTPNDPANGTGPYTIKTGTKLTTNNVQLTAYNTYHGGVPMVKELNFMFYADTKAEVADLKANKLDVADVGSQAAVSDVAASGYKAYEDKSVLVNFLMPNTLKAGSPLQNVKIRKALYEAIDPQALAKADGRTGTNATQLVSQDIPGYNPAISRPKIDPVQAKADLAAAGFPNGFTITFTYFAPHQPLAEELQKQMAAAGVKLTLDPQTVGAVLAKKALSGGTDLFYYGYGSALIDSSDVIQPLVVDTANYKNTSLDNLYNQASTTFNTVARLKLLQQINQAAMDDVAVIPLYTPDSLFFAVKSNLVVTTDNLSNYSGIDFWKVYSQ